MNATVVPPDLGPLVLYAALVIGLVAAIIVISFFLGERHRERATVAPYESGIAPTGSAAEVSPSFYLVALAFVVFDVESAFLYVWSLVARSMGRPAFLGAVAFMAMLMATLFYEWRQGILDGPSRRVREAHGHS